MVSALDAAYGEALRAIWLFGSRARGEAPRGEGSDVDLLVLLRGADWRVRNEVVDLAWAEAEAEGASPFWYGLLAVGISWPISSPTRRSGPRDDRPKRADRVWERDAVIDAVARLAAERDGVLPSTTDYDDEARRRADLPSFGTVRNRVGRWSEVRAIVAERLAAAQGPRGQAGAR